MPKGDKDCKVSVVVPAYNAERYLERCMESLAWQTYENMEVIVVDDGSDDLTGTLCGICERRYGSLVKMEQIEHGGVSRARLAGVRRAKGEYIAFVDADDWIEKDYLTSMLADMDGADMVAAGISREYQNAGENVVCEYNGLLPGRYASDWEKAELYGKMLYCGEPYEFGVLPYLCNKIFRKELLFPLLEETDKRIFDGEDAAMVYPYLLQAGEIVLTDSCKYHYVNHGDSASMKDTEDSYLNVSRLYQALYASFANSLHRKILMRQLDQYMRRMVWKKEPSAYLAVNTFLFPYRKVKAGARIILYGMGKVGTAFYQQIRQTRYCEVAAWADRRAGCLLDGSVWVVQILPEQIPDYGFDYIVIAVENQAVVRQIADSLVFMGVCEEKIVEPNWYSDEPAGMRKQDK